MGGKNSAPQAPDMSGLTTAATNAANEAETNGNNQLAWAQNQYKNYSGQNQDITDSMLADQSHLNDTGGTGQNLTQNALDQQHNSQALQNNALALQGNATNLQNNNAAEGQNLYSAYNNTTVPEIQQYQQEANNYASPGMIDQQMGAAQSNVAQNFDAQRNASTQQLESYGIDPSSTRYAAMDIGTRANQAAAQAAAGTQAALNTQQTGLGLQQNAVTMGQNLASNASAANSAANGANSNAISAANTANNAGNMAISANQAATGANNSATGAYTAAGGVGSSAVSGNNATYATGASAMGNPTSYYGIQGTDLTGAANMTTQGYQNQLAQFNANQQASSGIGSALGGLAGLGLGIASLGTGGGATLGGTALKSLFSANGGAVPQFAGGGNVTPGGAIPPSASPSGGQAVDDVPARLTSGEFVMPKDVASWYGEKQMQSMIQKARQERQNAVAKPAIGHAPPQAPTFQSRPQQGAIPMGR